MKNIILRLVGFYLNLLYAIAPKLAAKQGAFLFCYPLRVSMRKDQKDYLNKNLIKKVGFRNEEIALYKWGQGQKVILMVHGWQSHSFRWKKYIHAIDKEKYTVYAFDAPGHGLSSGNQINLPIYGTLLKQLIEKIGPIDTLIGHSFGAFACFYVLHEFKPKNVGRFVSLATPRAVTDFVDNYSGLMKIKKTTIEAVIAYFYDTYGFKLSYFSSVDFAKSLSLAGLIIHDKLDQETPVIASEKINEVWPQSTLIVTEGFGHKLNQKPVINAINEFLET